MVRLRFSRLAAGILLASFFQVVSRGQVLVPGQSQEHKWLPNERSILDISGVFVDPVQNAPFSATVDIISEQEVADGTVHASRSNQQIARDSQGRTYSEQGRKVPASTTGPTPIDTILIYDRVTERELLVNPNALSVRQSVVPPPGPAPGNAPAEAKKTMAAAKVTSEDLGTKTYEDLVLKGVRQTQPSGVVDEFWYSPDLSIYVIHSHQDPKLKETVTVSHIERSEPAPSKFAIPKGYTVIYRPGGGVAAPQLIHSVDPGWSADAQKVKFSGGVCIVALIVDTQGLPQDVHVVKSAGKGLDQKQEAVGKSLDERAVAAVKQYRFKPAIYEGHPVSVEVSVLINFRSI